MNHQKKNERISIAIKEAQDRISRSEGGENVYFGREGKGREEDAAEIAEMQKELELLKAQGGGTVVQNIQTNDNSTNSSQSTVTTQPMKDTAPASKNSSNLINGRRYSARLEYRQVCNMQ